jgi:RNA polymerase sigma factor (sigma-70 family)
VLSEGAAIDIDEATAVARARAGNLDAYEVLVARCTAPAHRAAVLLGAGADADDVVQEAFVKAYRQLGRFRGEAGFKAWLLAIVANETRNTVRSRRRRDGLWLRAAAREDPLRLEPDPAESALAGERRRLLVEQLRALDGRDREVLVCRYLLDLSEAETAVTLNLPKGTVKSRTARALGRLREQLGRQPGGQTGRRPDGQPGGQLAGHTGGQPALQPGGQPDGQTGGQPAGQQGGRPAGQAGGQASGQAGNETGGRLSREVPGA